MTNSDVTLPTGWKWTTIKEISKEIYRYPTFYGMDHLEQGVPVIRGEHILQNGTLSHDWSDYWFVSQDISSKFPKTIVEENDLIMSVRGSVGKIGIIDDALINAQVSPNCIRISPKRNLCFPRYLLYYLKSSTGRTSISDNVNATTIQTIKASSLSLTPIPLAPLPEQERIVERIESLFTQLDAGVAGLKRAQAALKRYRASVLKAACEGMLIGSEEIGDNPVSDGLPKEWLSATIEDVSTHIVDCLHSTPKFIDSGKYCIDTNCIEPAKIIFDKARFVSENTFLERIRRLEPKPDDILFSREGTIGIAVLIPENIELCLGQRMMQFRASDKMLPRFLMWSLLSPTFEKQWKPKIIGTTSPHINIRDIRKMFIPLPPLCEQKCIVEEIERRLSVVEELEQAVSANLKMAARLQQAILKRAFEGRLV